MKKITCLSLLILLSGLALSQYSDFMLRAHDYYPELAQGELDWNRDGRPELLLKDFNRNGVIEPYEIFEFLCLRQSILDRELISRFNEYLFFQVIRGSKDDYPSLDNYFAEILPDSFSIKSFAIYAVEDHIELHCQYTKESSKIPYPAVIAKFYFQPRKGFLFFGRQNQYNIYVSRGKFSHVGDKEMLITIQSLVALVKNNPKSPYSETARTLMSVGETDFEEGIIRRYGDIKEVKK